MDILRQLKTNLFSTTVKLLKNNNIPFWLDTNTLLALMGKKMELSLLNFKNVSERNNEAILFSSKFRSGKEDLLKLINNKLKKNKKFLFFDFTSSTYSKKIKTLL